MKLRRFTRRFRKDEDGSAVVELMLVLPMLIWALLAIWVFFDAYRAQTVNLKSAYTIGDMLSRETRFITPVYMNSLFEMHQFLVGANTDTRMRITVFRYDENNDQYEVRWSEGRGSGVTSMTTTQLALIRDRLPDMFNGEVGILTETQVGYEPPATVGLGAMMLNDQIVTRPRYAGQLCWNSVENGNHTTASC